MHVFLILSVFLVHFVQFKVVKVPKSSRGFKHICTYMEEGIWANKTKNFWGCIFRTSKKPSHSPILENHQYLADFLRFFRKFWNFWKIDQKIMVVSIYAFLITQEKLEFLFQCIFAFSFFPFPEILSNFQKWLEFQLKGVKNQKNGWNSSYYI